MTGIWAKTILRSRNAAAPEHVLSTLLVRMPRIILAEWNTHRAFCVSGDAEIHFDLPSGQRGRRKVHPMTIREFADKWHNGAAVGVSPAFNGETLSDLDGSRHYTTAEIRDLIGYANTMPLNEACRDGLVSGAFKNGRQWVASGGAWAGWRSTMGTRRFSLRGRLSKMQIRQLNETTGEVVTSTVRDCIISGTKPVWRLAAGEVSVVGTEDHRILTRDGWKRLGDIEVGVDLIATYKYGDGKGDPNRYNKIDGRWVQRWSQSVRGEVAERQGNCCAETGKPLDAGFHVHHVKPRHERPDLAFDIDNVVALNSGAHMDQHRTQGWQVGVPLTSTFSLVTEKTPEAEVDTYDLEIEGEFANFFADGVVVHNSRNAASTRAIPTERLIQQVIDDPFIPAVWGRNQKGMQAGADVEDIVSCEREWLNGRDRAVETARRLIDLGLHKQIVGRVLEAWTFTIVCVSATEWSNFLELRDHADAEPHIQILAREIRKCLEDESTVQVLHPGHWHMPFVTAADKGPPHDLIKLSVARCASTSYKTVDGFDMTLDRAVDLHDKLVASQPIHASPAEHVAQADGADKIGYPDDFYCRWHNEREHANFTGFRQYRHQLRGAA